jgi:hypothetical protein
VEVIVNGTVAKNGVDAQVTKISNRMEIARAGVLMAPAVIVDSQIKLVGKIPEIGKVVEWIRETGE